MVVLSDEVDAAMCARIVQDVACIFVDQDPCNRPFDIPVSMSRPALLRTELGCHVILESCPSSTPPLRLSVQD